MYKNNNYEVEKTSEIEQDFTKSGEIINELNFLTALSNRRLNCQTLSLDVKLHWSIDRITIVGKLKENILWRGRELVDFEMLMRLNEDKGFLVPVGRNAWKIIDRYDENIAYIEISNFQKGYGRIDFNPNKINEFIAQDMKVFIHKLFLNPHFSRADLSCDIINVPDDFILQYRIIEAVSTKIFYGKSKKAETFYWGARSSEKQVRMYNKKEERKKKREIVPEEIETWWRFEAQLRRGKASNWHEQIHDTLNNFSSPHFLPEDIKATDEIMLAGLMSDEKLWAKLSPASKRKYRNLLKQESQNDELTKHMRQSFSEQAEKLKNELDTWLAGFDVSEKEFAE